MNYESRLSRQPELTGYYSEVDDPSRRRRRWLIIGVLLIAAVLLAVWFAFGRNSNDIAAAEAAKKESQAPRVTVVVPGRQAVPSMITASGTLAARREMPVGVVGEGGLVSRVWVEPGTWVQQGQVLASIERSVQSQESAQLSAQINVAQADARLAQSELDRAQALVSKGFISKADIDRKTATRDAALARVRVAQAQLGAARARIGRLDIRAPAAGLVLTRAVEPGQVVGAGSGVLFRIARGGEMEMKALLAEADLTGMTAGLPATVTPVGSSVGFKGSVWQVSPVVDAQSRQGVVRIATGYDAALRPGGFASATIQKGMVDAPLLPESAVQSDAKGNYVYVVGAKNKIERRDVVTGSVTDKGVTVISGLSGNESVILSAGGFLNAGETVIPERAKMAGSK